MNCEMCQLPKNFEFKVWTHVCEPVTGNGQTNRFSSDAWGEHLGRQDPVDTPDTKGKVGDVNPDEDNSCPSCGLVRGPFVSETGDQGTNNELTDRHASGTGHENRPSPPAVNEHDSRQSGEEVHDTDYACCKEVDTVATQTDTAEDLGCKVDDSVDTSELLDNLEEACDRCSLAQVRCCEEISVLFDRGYEIRVRTLLESACLLLENSSRLDLQKFHVDVAVIGRNSSQPDQRLHGFFFAALAHKPSRAEWKEECSNGQDQGRQALKRKRKSPRNGALTISGATDVLSTIIEPERNHDSDSNAKLLQGDQATTQIWRGELTEIERDNHGKHTNGKTSNESSDEDHDSVDRSSLDDGSDQEYNVGEEQRPSPRVPVRDWAIEKGSKHGAKGQHGHHPAL